MNKATFTSTKQTNESNSNHQLESPSNLEPLFLAPEKIILNIFVLKNSRGFALGSKKWIWDANYQTYKLYTVS